MKKIIYSTVAILLSFGYSLAQTPTVATYDLHDLCPTETHQIAISGITFDSIPDSSVVITDVIVGNGLEDPILYYDSITQSTTIELKPINGTAPGVYNVQLNYANLMDTSYTNTTTFEVEIVGPTISYTPDYQFCANNPDANLFLAVDHTGGYFSVSPHDEFIYNGLVDANDYSHEEAIDYKYYYTDSINGCDFTLNLNMFFTYPPTINIDTIFNTSCGQSTGEITVSINSDYLPITSYWSNGAQNTDVVSGLAAGDYYINAIDSLGCKSQAAVVIENDGFDIVGDITNVACKGGATGAINLVITGGSGNYKVHWSTGQSTANISGLTSGHYLATVIDLDNGCVGYKNFHVEEPQEAFEVIYMIEEPSGCSTNDGALKFSYSYGGVAPYTFLWNTGATTDSLSNLSAMETYSVVVTDSLGCQAKYTATINTADAPYIENVKKIHTPCNESEGAIVLENIYPAYGDSIIGYEWSNGATTQNISNLAAGNYSLKIFQRDGCPTLFGDYTIENKGPNYQPEICILTVDTATNTNLVVWEKDFENPEEIIYYNIYRANNVTSEFEIIDTVDYDYISIYNDVDASPERRSWMYKISAVNVCGVESKLSKYHKTIHLTMNDGTTPEEKILSWDPYEGLEFFHYNLYRGTNVDDWQLIKDSIPLTTLLSFSDVVPVGATEVDYFVEVVPENGGCTATFGKAQDYNSSRSNKPSPLFEPGVGVGDFTKDSTNNIVVFNNIEFQAKVYPNPSNGNFKVEILDNVNDHNLTMSVMSINGKVIHQQRLNNEQNSVQLNVGSGIYFVQIQGQNTVENIRIIVQ